MSPSEIIDILGGPAAVSTALKLPPTTVGNWRMRNSIPSRHHHAIILLADGKVTPEQIILAHAPSQDAAA